MATIFLVSCVKSKLQHRARAQDLYTSPFFKKAKSYAIRNSDQWYVLSAKYGLISPEEQIDPYEMTLNKMKVKDRLKWTDKVLKQLLKRLHPSDKIVFLAGEKYREFLQARLKKKGYMVEVPLKGLSIGRQLRELTSTKSKDLDRLYEILERLESATGGRLNLAKSSAKCLPKRGVYLLYEPGEYRQEIRSAPRIVRIGTHMVSKGSKATLWNRLRTHKGTTNGAGNHRSSIFRLHVGNSLINRSEGRISVPSWGKGQSAPIEIRQLEKDLEQLVSAYIATMSFLYLTIMDEPSPWSDRAFIERNIIGLLSGSSGPLDQPSKSWLGNFSSSIEVRTSGLWNINHIRYIYNPCFLDILEQYVDATIGKARPPAKSIAPKGWYEIEKRREDRGQLFLFEDFEE